MPFPVHTKAVMVLMMRCDPGLEPVCFHYLLCWSGFVQWRHSTCRGCSQQASFLSGLSSLWAETVPGTHGCITDVGQGCWTEAPSDTLLQRVMECKKHCPLPCQLISRTLGKQRKFTVILHSPTLLFLCHSDLLLKKKKCFGRAVQHAES